MRTLGWIVGFVIVILGLIYFWQHTGAQNPSDTTVFTTPAATTSVATSTEQTSGVSAGVSAGASVTVTYDGSAFSPASVSIKKGDSVTFVNTSSSAMWVASDPHPAHNGYDGTARQTHCAPSYSGAKPFDECSNAKSFTFTFDKVGSWGYHNHQNDSAHGTVVVTE